MMSAAHWGRPRDLRHTEPSPCISLPFLAFSGRRKRILGGSPTNPANPDTSGSGLPTERYVISAISHHAGGRVSSAGGWPVPPPRAEVMAETWRLSDYLKIPPGESRGVDPSGKGSGECAPGAKTLRAGGWERGICLFEIVSKL